MSDPAASPTRPRHPACGFTRRRGFSLTELLVVIGILVLLIAIVTVGLSGVLGGQGEKDTTVRLEALNSMVAAYAQSDAGSTSGQQLPPRVTSSGDTAYASATPTQYWFSTVDAATDETGPIGSPPGVDAPLNVSGLNSASPDALLLSAAAGRSQAVIRQLRRVQQNDQAINDLPASSRTGDLRFDPAEENNYRVWFYVEPTPPPRPTTVGPWPLDPPLLLDGFDGVILYVPPTGVTGLAFAGDETWDADDRLVPVNNRGFFMSAGNDGDFTTGDDNLYSTDVRAVRVP